MADVQVIPQVSQNLRIKMPNHSLNWTHCGMQLKALHFMLGL